MSGHMFNEDGICDCTECWPTNTQRPNRETTMHIEVGKTYDRDSLTEDDWAKAVKAIQPGTRLEAWWRRSAEEFGRRGVTTTDGRHLSVGVAVRLHDGQPYSEFVRFTVLELPAHLDPANALVVRDRDGDLWSRHAVGWQSLGAQVSTESLDDIADIYAPLTVVIDADGNVVDEGDR